MLILRYPGIMPGFFLAPRVWETDDLYKPTGPSPLPEGEGVYGTAVILNIFTK